MNDIILEINYGGLGDHLFYSLIPRLYKEINPKGKIYISNYSNFRSSEIKEIVWNSNPYIDGFVNERGTKPAVVLNNFSCNIIQMVCKQFNCYNQDEKEPEIYYIPKINPNLNNITLVDLNYKSFIGAYSKVNVMRIVNKFNNVVYVNPPKWIKDKEDCLYPKSLSEYIDCIASAENFICYASGGATLSSAISKPSIVLYGYGQKKIFHHSPIHNYIYVGFKSKIENLICFFILKLRNKIKLVFSNTK